MRLRCHFSLGLLVCLFWLDVSRRVAGALIPHHCRRLALPLSSLPRVSGVKSLRAVSFDTASTSRGRECITLPHKALATLSCGAAIAIRNPFNNRRAKTNRFRCLRDSRRKIVYSERWPERHFQRIALSSLLPPFGTVELWQITLEKLRGLRRFQGWILADSSRKQLQSASAGVSPEVRDGEPLRTRVCRSGDSFPLTGQHLLIKRESSKQEARGDPPPGGDTVSFVLRTNRTAVGTHTIGNKNTLRWLFHCLSAETVLSALHQFGANSSLLNVKTHWPFQRKPLRDETNVSSIMPPFLVFLASFDSAPVLSC